MSKREKKLIKRAIKDYKTIYPCGHFDEFSKCFTEIKDELVFWFNTEDGSTHIIKQK